MQISQGNVLYLCVAKKDGPKVAVMASYSHQIVTDEAAVLAVLQRSELQVVAGRQYNFADNQNGWHLIAVEGGLIYLLVSKHDYPQRCANACLAELQSTYSFLRAKTGGKDTLVAVKNAAKKPFSELCSRYDNLTEIDKLTSVTRKVEIVKNVMHENIAQIIENTAKVEEIQLKSQDLLIAVGIFKKEAADLRQKLVWRNRKMWLIIGIIITAILAIIVGVAYSTMKNTKS